MVGASRERRGTSNPKGYILCRICESVVPVEVMSKHTKECIEIKKAESKEKDLDRKLLLLEHSLQRRIDEQHNKWSHRLGREKHCEGLIALCTVTKEVRKADWEDVASPGLLRGLETTVGSILEHVQDDDLMFQNYCQRVQEFTAKKLTLIRDVHRRKFQADQSILQSRTDSFALMHMNGAAALAMGSSTGVGEGGGGQGGIGRGNANNSSSNNNNNRTNNRTNNTNNRSNKRKNNNMQHAAFSPVLASTSSTSPPKRPSLSSTPLTFSMHSGNSSNNNRRLNSRHPGLPARPHNRITRGFSVGADIHDPETADILAKFKRKNVTNKVNMTDFQVIKPISKGAFGKVYLCRRRKFPDLFAVKVLPKIQSSLKTDVTQVLKERRIMSNLDNPFVVDLMFSFQSESSLFLVMDFMPGGDLFSLLQNVGALAEEPSRFYIAEILHAIRYLHSHGKKKKIERENNLASPFF